MMIPTKQTVYIPVRVEDELPAKNMQVAILHKKWGFTSGFYMHEWKSFDHFRQVGYKENDITHWLKPQEAFVFTPEQLNDYTQSVIKQALEIAAEKAKTIRNKEFYMLSDVNKQSITKTFEKTFKHFKV